MQIKLGCTVIVIFNTILNNLTVSRYLNVQWHSGIYEINNKRLLHIRVFVLHSKDPKQNKTVEKVKTTVFERKVKQCHCNYHKLRTF